MDPDIKDSIKHLHDQESVHGVWNLPKDEDVQLESDPVCSSAGCTQFKHKHLEPAYPVDYPVPNLGQDREIKTNLNSLKKAEDIVHHHWEFGTKDSKDKWHNVAKDTNYDFTPGLDHDVKDSQANLANTEGRMGHTYHP
mmetsp:Transcript_38174/g.58224  ORF Transcript_38174/g.58224 Transcript_38174/m.58224 type:complete len:139 (-) Transcript_38174:70-486(-)